MVIQIINIHTWVESAGQEKKKQTKYRKIQKTSNLNTDYVTMAMKG